eukprot:CAMPEP_0196665304 /NCGR_PEP_ID=MMETSP1086-20130531/60408_1 /TAXON_ID=77921 /ORGANISM="Cyanoptyche  gloeocystis , Strain SAG4.97" /LENGTH=183 /DNA_ID=CAMNT_0042001973 /DNA_START=57 /DNA_END=605 /DNA_ORIENTATION=+
MDMGPCDKVHSVELKTEYEAASKKRDYGYEHEQERHLETYVAECDKKITRAQKRLEESEIDTSALMPVSKASCDPEVERISSEIQVKLKEAEALGENGEVEKSIALMHEVEELKQKKATAQAQALLSSLPQPKKEEGGTALPTAAILNPNQMPGNVNQKLRVCDVCGAFLSILDSDQRLADHF